MDKQKLQKVHDDLLHFLHQMRQPAASEGDTLFWLGTWYKDLHDDRLLLEELLRSGQGSEEGDASKAGE